MKYLKRFNEELDSYTYLSAGKKLKQKGHSTRGQELIDYSLKDKNINDEFDFYHNGEKLTAKWNYEKSHFETTDKKALFISCEKGSICKIVYRDRPRRSLLTYPAVYVNTRQEAIRLLNFIKSVKKIDPSAYPKVNDLYRENITSAPIGRKIEMEDSYPQTIVKEVPKKKSWFNRSNWSGR